VALFGARRGGAVDVAIVDDQVERFDRRVFGIAAMDGLALVADDHVLHEPPDDVVEDRDAEEREAVRPWDEDRAEDDEGDAGRPIEVFLEVELIVPAGGAALDQRAGRRCRDFVLSAAVLAGMGRLAAVTAEARLAFRAEKVNGGRSYLARSRYRFSLGSTTISSPSVTNGGTCTTIPFSSVAGL